MAAGERRRNRQRTTVCAANALQTTLLSTSSIATQWRTPASTSCASSASASAAHEARSWTASRHQRIASSMRERSSCSSATLSRSCRAVPAVPSKRARRRSACVYISPTARDTPIRTCSRAAPHSASAPSESSASAFPRPTRAASIDASSRCTSAGVCTDTAGVIAPRRATRRRDGAGGTSRDAYRAVHGAAEAVQ